MKRRFYPYWILPLILFFGLTAYDTSPAPISEPPVAGPLVWHDLVTPDMDRSREFYSAVFGWEFRVLDVKGLRLAAIYSGEARIGGAIEVPRANQAVWIKAILVDDLDSRVSLVKRNGGHVLLPPADIPGRGTQVILEGAEGEEFSFIGNADAAFSAGAGPGNNRMVWSELWADSPESSQAFYQTVFGVSTENVTVDEMPYWVFQWGDQKLAGMIRNPITNQGTQWVPYVLSDTPAEVIASAKDAGAFVVLEPSAEVRGGKVGIFQDPLGAMVCVQKQ